MVMKLWILTALLIPLTVSLPPPPPEEGWTPIRVETTTARGAYNRVREEYVGRLIMGRLLEAYHKMIIFPPHLEGSNVKIVFDAESVLTGFQLRCTAILRRVGYPWPIWYMQCILWGPLGNNAANVNQTLF